MLRLLFTFVLLVAGGEASANEARVQEAQPSTGWTSECAPPAEPFFPDYSQSSKDKFDRFVEETEVYINCIAVKAADDTKAATKAIDDGADGEIIAALKKVSQIRFRLQLME